MNTDSTREEKLQTEEAKCVRILEALDEVEHTQGWKVLTADVFDGLCARLVREIQTEAREDDPDPKKLNRLSGELRLAEKYADLKKMGQPYRLTLQGIRNQLHGH